MLLHPQLYRILLVHRFLVEWMQMIMLILAWSFGLWEDFLMSIAFCCFMLHFSYLEFGRWYWSLFTNSHGTHHLVLSKHCFMQWNPFQCNLELTMDRRHPKFATRNSTTNKPNSDPKKQGSHPQATWGDGWTLQVQIFVASVAVPRTSLQNDLWKVTKVKFGMALDSIPFLKRNW